MKLESPSVNGFLLYEISREEGKNADPRAVRLKNLPKIFLDGGGGWHHHSENDTHKNTHQHIQPETSL
jgi:hypothetical protein